MYRITKIFTHLFLLLFFTCLNLCLNADPLQNIKFSRLNVLDGLSNPIVFDITQDKTGFIWIATNNGLNKYDGYEFTTFLPDPENPRSNKTISGEVVVDLMIDSFGLLWIGSVGAGLECYDPKTGIFKHYPNDPDDSSSLSHNSAYGLSEDEKGNIWIGTLGGGLNYFDRRTQKFKHYRHDPTDDNSLGNDKIYSILIGKNNDLWIGLNEGLDHLDLNTGKFSHFKHDPNDPGSISLGILPGLLIDSNDQLWVTSFGGGLNRYDDKLKKFIHYTHDPDDYNSISYNDQVKIFEDSQNNIWIPTHGGGIDLYNPEKDNFIHYKNIPGDQTSLSFNTLISGFEDRSGVLWFATYGAGICKYDKRTDWYELIQTIPQIPNSLSNNDVHSIYEDSEGITWIGTENGLNRYDPNSCVYTHYYNDPKKNNSISGNSIWGIEEDSNGNLWIATNTGISKMDRKTDQFIQYKHNPNSNSLNEDRTWSLCIDNNDEIWVGTQSSGINRFNQKTGKFKFYDIGNFALLLKTDKDGDVWAGTEKGLYKFDYSKDEFISISHSSKKKEMFGPGSFGAILKDSRDEIWVGNSSGLYQKKGDHYKRYTQNEGLIDRSVSGIIEEKPGILWILTANGLSRFDYDNMTFENYNVGVFNRADASIRISSGDMWFGTPNGLFKLYPDRIQLNRFKPNVVLTSFKILDKEIQLEKPISELKEYNLSYKDRYFSFEFSALDFSNTNQNKFKYKLEGFDDNWIYLEDKSHRHFASYTNIPGGEYIFRVEGSNNDGIWGEKGVKLKLIIAPPFWETNLFYITVSLIFIFIFFFIIFYIIKLLREISDRKNAENSLVLERKQLLSIFDSIEESIYVSDTNSFEILYVNKAMKNLFHKELIGKICYEEFHNFKSPCKFCTNEIILKQNPKPYHWEFYNLLIEKNLTIVNKIIKWPDGRNVRFEIAADVTENKKMEERLQQAQKMEAIGTLAGGIAHDFNNLLFPIIGMSEMLINDLPSESKELKKAESIFKAGIRSSELVKQILTFSRKSEHKMTPISIQKVLKEVLKLSRSTIPTNIEITQDIQTDCDLVMGDSTQIHQVAMNLITNAYHAVEEFSGKIDVKLKEIKLISEELTDSTLESGRYVLLSISDSGSGIDPSVIDKIFEPYFTTKKKGKGTGLGLSVVYGIIKEHKGEIKVYSELNKGTKFNIFIPIITKQFEKKDEINKVEKYEKGTERILLVDDEEMIINIEKEILERFGYTVTAYTSSSEALESFIATPDSFDLIITDNSMPKITGVQLAEKVVAIKPDIPVIICSGLNLNLDEDRKKALGIKGVMIKPIDSFKLSKLLRKVLDNK